MIFSLLYPTADIFQRVLFGTYSTGSIPERILVFGRYVYPLLTISVVLAWALYPLSKRVDRELPLDR